MYIFHLEIPPSCCYKHLQPLDNTATQTRINKHAYCWYSREKPARALLCLSCLARLFDFTASSDSFDNSFLKPSLTPSVIGGHVPLGSANFRYQSRFNENAAFQIFNDTSHVPVVTQRDPNHSPPNTDLRMD